MWRARNGSKFDVTNTFAGDAGDGYTARLVERVTGSLDKRGRNARGTYRAHAVVHEGGQPVDRSATPPGRPSA